MCELYIPDVDVLKVEFFLQSIKLFSVVSSEHTRSQLHGIISLENILMKIDYWTINMHLCALV